MTEGLHKRLNPYLRAIKMFKKKIFIHCGIPKTGTSALQVQFAQNKDMFARYGYEYPDFGAMDAAVAGGITSGNGSVLAAAYLPVAHPASTAKNRAKVVAKVRRSIAGTGNHVVFSSEFFTIVSDEGFGELVADLSDLGDVHLIFFVREQVNLLAASYIQGVKRSMRTQFPDEFFGDLDFSNRPFLAYHTYFTALKEAAPNATIVVKPYELSKDHPAGLMGLFLEMIDAEIPIADFPQNKVVNLSPSPKEVRLMIEINKHGPRKHFSDMLVEASHQAGRSKVHSSHRIVPPKAVTQIREFYAAENEAFFRNFCQTKNIYGTYESSGDFINLRDLNFETEDVLNILGSLLVKLDHRLTAIEKE